MIIINEKERNFKSWVRLDGETAMDVPIGAFAQKCGQLKLQRLRDSIDLIIKKK